MSSNPKKQQGMGIAIPIDTPTLEESGENLVKTMNGSFFDDPKMKTKVFLKSVVSVASLQAKTIIYNKSVYAKKTKNGEEYKNYQFFLTENGIYYMNVRFFICSSELIFS